MQIVFETHAISEDNESGVASGWNHGRLSDTGRVLAKELCDRRRTDGIQVVFTSDLRRAVETADIAFGDTGLPILHDWRLRECNYGVRNGAPRVELERTRREHLDEPYPGGESWRQAVRRVGRFLDDLHLGWKGSRVLVIGHTATRWAFEHYLNGIPLEDLIEAEFQWRPGWEYVTHEARLYPDRHLLAKPEMPGKTVVDLIGVIENAGIDVWLDGG
jgi:broad specificity phosphatase PhoE